MITLKSVGIRIAIVIPLSLGVGGCVTTDYAGGVNAFSQAVTQVNTTEQTLAAADNQIEVDNYMLKATGRTAVVDLQKCRAIAAPYKQGDCVVQVNEVSPPAEEPSSMTGLVKYTALLSAVLTDKTCASLQSDASSIASSVSDMARDAKQPALASAASPLATVISTVGCLAIDREQLSILREATKDANPVIQVLVPLIAQNDTDLYDTILEHDIDQLSTATVNYNTTKSATDLAKAVSLAQAVDKAQASQPGQLVAQLGRLHQALTNDLSDPTVNMKMLENDAKAFIADAQAVHTAVETLAQKTSSPAASAKSAKSTKRTAN